jgi:hypothetical protein
MGIWTEAVERKAELIHSQLAAARQLAAANNFDVESISAPYFDLLRSLYADEYPFAQLTDTSDLVARFAGPAVDVVNPTVSIVISIFTDLREQIRSIARSVVGLSTDRALRWPSNLDPHLSGVTHGSLIVGVEVAPPTLPNQRQQMELEGVSDQLLESVRTAVRGLSTVARFISDTNVSPSLRDSFPDPAVRDTVLVAARRLSPTGRKGIDSVSFFSPETVAERPAVLTPKSRIAIASELEKPLTAVARFGSFDGVLREIDLDARRFEIRGVHGVGAIRCVYGERHDANVRAALDAQVRVSGYYESTQSGRPRLVAAEGIEILSRPPEQAALLNNN